MIDMTLEGPSEFAVHPSTGGAKACYRFNQDPVHISYSLIKECGGVVLHRAAKRGLFRAVPLALNRGAMRRPPRRMGLPAYGLHATLPKG